MDRDRIVNVRTAAYANDMEIESFRFLMIEKIPILNTAISRTIKSDRIIFEPRVVMIVKTQGYHNIEKKSTQVGYFTRVPAPLKFLPLKTKMRITEED
jgi:DUF438 domain-containing protein